jgi:hypothetical protein
MKEFESIGDEELVRLTERFLGFKVPPPHEAPVRFAQRPKIENGLPKTVEIDGKKFKVRDAGEFLKAANIAHKMPNGQKPGLKRHPRSS